MLKAGFQAVIKGAKKKVRVYILVLYCPSTLGTHEVLVQYEMVRCRQTCLPYATLPGNDSGH